VPNPSNATHTGMRTEKDTITNIVDTRAALVSSVNVSALPTASPGFRTRPPWDSQIAGPFGWCDVQQNGWVLLDAGIDGTASILGFDGGSPSSRQPHDIASAGSNSGSEVAGYATWDTKSGAWTNNRGCLVGRMSLRTALRQARVGLGHDLLLAACQLA